MVDFGVIQFDVVLMGEAGTLISKYATAAICRFLDARNTSFLTLTALAFANAQMIPHELFENALWK